MNLKAAYERIRSNIESFSYSWNPWEYNYKMLKN